MQVCFEVVGYLLEELRDAKNFEALKEDVASANIFIGSLIFIEELAEKARQRLQPLAQCDSERSTADAVYQYQNQPGAMRAALHGSRRRRQ